MAYHMMLFFSADHYSNQPNSKIYIQRILALDKEKYVKEVYLVKEITVGNFP